MAETSTPLGLAGLGVAVLLIISGVKGVSVGDVLAGKTGDKLDPKGGRAPSSTEGGNGGDTGIVEDATDFIDNAAGSLMAKGVGTFDGKRVALWIIPILKYARRKGWKGKVQSGYRTFAEQSALYNGRASNSNPVAKPGSSNHEKSVYPGGAVDVTDAVTLDRILKASQYRDVLVWAGSKDPVHFSHPHNGSY